MKKPKFVVSLTTRDNDYQQEQALSAQQAAAKAGVEIELLYAENDAVLQSQQLLKVIQTSPEFRPAGIIFEPVGGTAMPQVAKAAVTAGIGWVVLNRDAEYLAELRRVSKVPAFSITSDHTEIGRIQGRQIAALLPSGGSILLVHANTFDFILDTVPATHNINPYINLLRRDGTLGFVGAPPEPVPLEVAGLLFGRKKVAGSIIGGIRETQEMLDFCGKHNVTADIETIGVQDIDKAYARLLKNDVKYRFVIDIASLK